MRLAAILIAATLAGPALAQEGTSVEDVPLSTGTDPDAPASGEIQVGQTYVNEEFTDWQMRCVRAPEGQNDPCQLYQLLEDQDGNAVAEITLTNLQGAGELAGAATVITPLETALQEGLRMRVDSGREKVYPFQWCSAIGCFARIGMTADEVASFRRGNVAKITIVPIAAPDASVVLDVSLSGFTAGYKAVEEANAG